MDSDAVMATQVALGACDFETTEDWKFAQAPSDVGKLLWQRPVGQSEQRCCCTNYLKSRG